MTSATHARTIRDLAREYGASLAVTRSCHYRIDLPNGRVVFAPGTPSDWRAVRNLRANLRRAAETAKESER